MTIQSDNRLNSISRLFARVGSLVVVFIGCLVLIGWSFDIAILKSILPGTVTMKANTAVGFLLAGVSLLLSLGNLTDQRIHFLKQVCAFIVSLIGLLTLFQYLSGLNLGIDQLFFKEPEGTVSTTIPGRMAPNTALNFLLIGLGLLFCDWKTRKGHYPTQFLIIPACIIALLGLLGYAYGVTELKGLLHYTPMAINTAVAFIFLCFATLFARPETGLIAIFVNSKSGGFLARRLLPIAIILPITLGWIGLLGERAGLYDAKFGLSLIEITHSVILVVVILMTAHVLNRVDVARQQAEEAQFQMQANLEKLVEERTTKLAASELDFRNLADNVLVGVYLTSLKGKFLYSNTTLAHILGYDSPEELKSAGAIPHYLDPGAHQTLLANLQRDGKVDFFETVLLTRQKSPIHVMMSVTLNNDILTGTVVNITERKHAEEVQRASEIRYRRLFEAARDGILILDAKNGMILDVNPFLIEMLGYTREQFLEKKVWELGFFKDVVANRLNLLELQQKEFIRYEDMPLETANGKKLEVEFISNVYLVDKKKVIQCNIRDITERKQAEEKLQHNEDLLTQTGKLAKVGGWELDLQTMTLIWTLETYHIHEVDPSLKPDLENAINFYAPQARPIISEAIRQATEEGTGFDLELPFITAKNKPIWVHTIGQAEFHKGKCIRLFGAFQDITERKQAEEELCHINSELEHRVELRTRAFKKAKEEADIANQAKSEFLSRMSHELRTPLNSILGFAQIMEMDELKPEHEKNLKHILKAGYHLLDLINEVLDIARIDSGRLALSPEPVELQSLILETLDTVTPMAKNRHVITELVDSSSNGLFVKADRQRLSQVLLNLINNAIKYNREGGRVAISIDRKDRFTPGFSFSTKEAMHLSESQTNSGKKITAPLVILQSVIRISITDTGSGISSKQLPRLFTAFDRGSAAQSETEGTGLGLAVSKKLVEVMGGTINVETIPGTGSTFWVELLQVEKPVNTADVILTLEKIKLDVTIKGCVLYIEDNLSNLQLVEEILTKRPGVKLITALRGKLTLELALLHKPDLILLDLNLPDISGLEVFTLLRADPQTKDIPVVVLSADATSARIETLKSAGIQDYITKPLNVVKFLELIDRMIRGAKSMEE